jgi:hypothetical protein
MPYALFEDDQKLSQEYPTEHDVWKHADAAGLVDVVDGDLVLEDGYSIKLCSTDGEPGNVPPTVN